MTYNNRILRILALTVAAACVWSASAERLVILHTNDTHSQIDPDDRDNLGGIGRRKVIVDSVRAAEDHVLMIDAGDAVQGTLYFNLYGGKVEQLAMNALGYDLRILGNHEFDNGADSLAHVLALADSKFLSTNYDLHGSGLEDMFDATEVIDIDGHSIGFMAINLDPAGMISEGNYDGVRYLDAIEAADAAAWWLRNEEHCDLVVAITHIGYNPVTPPGDMMLASHSKNIDIIIGGHSHDTIDPRSDKYRWLIPNAEGRNVLVTQAGKQGKNVGEITVDLETLVPSYRLIPVDSRLDARLDREFDEMLAPYRAGVDSLMTRVPVGRTHRELPQESAALLNWATDVVLDRGRQMADSVDFAILNKGGLRRGLPKGTVHEGQIITMMPFDNHVEVIDIKGADLIEAFGQMARVDGNGVSDGVEITFVPGTEELRKADARVVSATLGGRQIEPERIYRVATIDYLSGGGDYMPSLRNHTTVARSENTVYEDLLEYLRRGNGRGRTINPPAEARMHPVE